MWTIDCRVALLEHDLLFVRSVHILRPNRELIAVLHAAGGREDPVPPVALVELRTFDCRMMFAAVEHDAPFVDYATSIAAHPIHAEHGVETGAALRPRVHEVERSVVVPQRTRIDPAFRFLHQRERLPWSARIARARHVDAAIGIADVDPEKSVVLADARRPEIGIRRWQPRRRVCDQLPMFEIARLHDRQSRHTVKARCDEEEVAPRYNQVRTGEPQ